MNRKNLKYFFILLISMAISEILNGIVYLSSYFFINNFIAKDLISHISVESIDIISRILVVIFALLSPISVLLIWIFSKINMKNSNSRDDSL